MECVNSAISSVSLPMLKQWQSFILSWTEVRELRKESAYGCRGHTHSVTGPTHVSGASLAVRCAEMI